MRSRLSCFLFAIFSVHVLQGTNIHTGGRVWIDHGRNYLYISRSKRMSVIPFGRHCRFFTIVVGLTVLFSYKLNISKSIAHKLSNSRSLKLCSYAFLNVIDQVLFCSYASVYLWEQMARPTSIQQLSFHVFRTSPKVEVLLWGY